MHDLPLNKPCLVGNETKYLSQVATAGALSGPGLYTHSCEGFIEALLCEGRVLLTPSCTSALELAARACNIGEGDEVILPAFTHPATANAFLTTGALPVFIDITPDTCNIDDRLIEAAITERTRAIVPVHYAGVACAMNDIIDIANRHGLQVIEDAAHSVGACYRGKQLGALGDFGAFSFHSTKNVFCGEGGALIIKDPTQVEQIEMMREHGTDRQRYMRAEVDNYSWMMLGASSLISELSAAFLLGQLEQLEDVTNWRVNAFNKYCTALRPLEDRGEICIPAIPPGSTPNGHIFYGVCQESGIRDKLIQHLQNRGIGATFHYLPLHLSPQGKTYGYRRGQLPVTEKVSSNIFRLPIFFGITDNQLETVISEIFAFFGETR
jgi:dTDP-4-amino-4,6-dideoxygalactose transaminase